MLILDGQHRMRALRAVVSPSEEEKTKLGKLFITLNVPLNRSSKERRIEFAL